MHSDYEVARYLICQKGDNLRSKCFLFGIVFRFDFCLDWYPSHDITHLEIRFAGAVALTGSGVEALFGGCV